VGCGDREAQLERWPVLRLSRARRTALGRDARETSSFGPGGRPPLALSETDVLVTCTSDGIRPPEGRTPGTFIAAVGADEASRNRRICGERVVVDLLPHALIGDLHHAIEGSMRARTSRRLSAVVMAAAGTRSRERSRFSTALESLQDLARRGGHAQVVRRDSISAVDGVSARGFSHGSIAAHSLASGPWTGPVSAEDHDQMSPSCGDE
jgi:hypothetical protein